MRHRSLAYSTTVGARTVIIVNPRSSGGAAGKRWPELAETIGAVLPFEERITQAPGDGTRLAREALLDGATQIVALGGDGTINEVINGFFDGEGKALRTNATFGLIPFGTGGDFRRSVKVPRDIAEAAKVLVHGQVQALDIGRMTYTAPDRTTRVRMFGNIASFGVSGVVDRLVNESAKRLGRFSFLLASARATLTYKNQRVALVFDDDETSRVELTINTVAVANGRYFGGAMKVAPDAELTDGLFDVVSLGDLGFLDLLSSGRRIYRGSHLSLDKVSSRRARSLHALPLDENDAVQIDLDGENVGTLPARFEILPAAIRMMVPVPAARVVAGRGASDDAAHSAAHSAGGQSAGEASPSVGGASSNNRACDVEVDHRRELVQAVRSDPNVHDAGRSGALPIQPSDVTP